MSLRSPAGEPQRRRASPDGSELMEGARNCIAGYTGVRPGERVLIWTDDSPEVEPEVVEALVAAAEEAEAQVATLHAQPPTFRLGEPLSQEAALAMDGSNAVIHVFERANAASIDSVPVLRYLFEHDLRVTAVIAPTVESMSSEWARYPMGLYWELFRLAAAQVTDDAFVLEDDRGTHLEGRLRAWRSRPSSPGRPAGVGSSGSWTFFPSGNIPLHPESPLQGTVVFDSLEGFGLLDEPLRLEIRDHRVQALEGGGEGGHWLGEMLQRYENSDYVCELCWGIHPKASRSEGIGLRSVDTTLYRHPGIWHIGLGMWPGVGVPCDFHWDGGGMGGSLTIGSERVIEEGRLTLLEDPRLWRAAEEYGDPELLLRVLG